VNQLSGNVGNGDAGWVFEDVRVATPRSTFAVTGRVIHGQGPNVVDFTVNAERFAFQEWSGLLTGLTNIGVESAFRARLSGPVTAMHTAIDMRSTGGDVDADLVLDTAVEGWHGNGSAKVVRLDLARWLNRPDRPSDITGAVRFDLDLHLGRHFPAGNFQFNGPHAAFLDYEADNLATTGTI